MKFFIIIFSVILLFSCSSVKKNVNYNPLTSKKDLRTLGLSGTISSTFPGFKQSVSFSLKIAGKDSVKFEAYGPLSIIVGKLFSTPDFFKFYNIITNEAFKGTPSAKNLNLAMNMPLSFADFVAFLRNEPAQNIETFSRDMSYNSETKVLFKSKQKDYVDYVLVNGETNDIIQQQRKTFDGTIILNVLYNNYEEYEGYSIAKNITFNFPELNGSIIVRNSVVKINEKYNKPFNFNLPASVKLYNFN